MSVKWLTIPSRQLHELGLINTHIHYQQGPDELVQDTLRLGEGVLSDTGALVIKTGEFTGRSPKDKYTIKDECTAATVHWNDFNIPMEEKYFHLIKRKIVDYLNKRNELWVRDAYVSADPRYRINIRIINEHPSINLFAYNMFLRPNEKELIDYKNEWIILSAPGLKLKPNECGTRQHNASIISFKHKT
ncbi:MAG: phosphoenolpyruvate carboxykinase (ATP), partial [Chitinophagaceae bacterium]